MEEINYNKIKKYIETILKLVYDDLSKEAIHCIKHYLLYDEYEMSFEILFIEIMKLKIIPVMNCEMNIRIGKQLKLDKESIYEENFWERFIEMNKKICDI